jgi:acyl-CoA dehydrogenase
MMGDASYLDWPFLEPRHKALARDLEAWAEDALRHVDHGDVDGSCRALVRALGEAGWLRHCVADPEDEGGRRLESRSICLARDILARRDALADFAFAMQGLGTGSIALFGGADLRRAYLPQAAAGRTIAAFALTEPESGSDVAAMTMSARREGDGYVLVGEKTFISNGGIADHYVVVARTGEAPGARGLSAFVVDADTKGLSVAERLSVMAPHPLARLRFDGCRVGSTHLLGQPGEGFKVAMATLDVFRASVGAAALGMARRAMDEAVARSLARRMFGGTLGNLQMTQGRLADMAVGIDAAALLVYRAAWARDRGAKRVTRESAMAKLFATEAAQDVIDGAVQLFGGMGVLSGTPVERLYREIRALRIYEGASEVQKLVIARQILGDHGAPEAPPP